MRIRDGNQIQVRFWNQRRWRIAFHQHYKNMQLELVTLELFKTLEIFRVVGNSDIHYEGEKMVG